jgi:hypothetical protein
MTTRHACIPADSWPRGMKADTAAAYCEVSRTKFLELVEKGVLPPSKDLDGMPRRAVACVLSILLKPSDVPNFGRP